MDPKTGLVSQKANLKGVEQKILDAIEEARTGVFTPNRENDELTRALVNPEHPRRTQGNDVIPWYEGFLEWNKDYRTRARKKMEEEKKRKLEEEQRKQEAGSRTPSRPKISACRVGTPIPAAGAADRLT